MRYWRQQLGAAVCAGMLAAPVHAAINPPTGAWVIGPIHAESSSGLTYCSMKNAYADGSTIVFARDAARSDSIAVDLGRKQLTVGAQYDVTLDVGMVTRDFIGIAATAEVMIIQVGDDPGFYDMLRKKDVMQVSFANVSLSYGLDGSADALDALAACADDMKGGKKGAEIEVAVKAPGKRMPPGKEREAVDKQEMSISNQAFKSSMKSEIERLEEENRRLLLENQSISRQLTQQELEDPDVVIAKAQQKKLKSENQDLKQQLAEKKKSSLAAVETALAMPTAKPAVKAEPKTTPKAAEKNADKPSEEVAAAPEKRVDAENGILVRLLAYGHIPAQLSGLSSTSAVYTWKDGAIDGGGVEDALRPGQTIGDAVGEYTTRAKRGCQGDYAEKLAEAEKLDKGYTMVQGEMACIDGKNDTASAILFLSDGQTVAAVMFDGPTAQVADVLAKRDALAQMVDFVVKEPTP